MRFADAQMAFPTFCLAIMMVAALGGNALNLILVLGISRWMIYARVVFGLTRSLRATAVRGGGDAVWRRRFLHHVAAHPAAGDAGADRSSPRLQVAQMILQETALSFLGLGLPPPAATWGNILAEGNTRLFIAPWIANSAGVAIILLVWGVNMLGNGLREQYDPRMLGR